MALPIVDKGNIPYIVDGVEKTLAQVGAGLAILTNPGVLHSDVVTTDGTNDVECIVYDNASAATGDVKAHVKVPGANQMGGESTILTGCQNGIFITLTGTGSKVIVRYID